MGKTKKIRLALLPCLALLLISCSVEQYAGSITGFDCPYFDSGELLLEVGAVSEGWVSPSLRDEDSFSPDDVMFMSDDSDVAEIEYIGSKHGSYLYYRVTAVGEGETYIYVLSSDGSISSEKQSVKVTAAVTETEPETEPEPKTETETETEPKTETETEPETETETESETETETEPDTEPEPEQTISADGSSMTAELISELEGKAVFWAPGGNKIHLRPDCRTFKLGIAYAGTLEEALSVRSEGWCGICSKNAGVLESNPYATKEALADCYTYEDYMNKIPSSAFD